MKESILHSVLTCLGDGVVVADQKGRFVLWNPAAESIVGLGPADSVPEEWPERYGVFLPDTVTPYPADRLPLVRAIRGESVDEDEQYIRNPKHPEGVWLSVTGRPLVDDDGNLHGGVVVLRDITARKRAAEALCRAHDGLERRIEERTRELRASNENLRAAKERAESYAKELERSYAELEQFAYLASHDLQEPLRMVASYTKLLAKRYGGRLDSDADEFIAYAVEGASRMQELIEALLTYSRVGSRDGDYQEIDAGAALDRALASLELAIEESGAEVVREHLPTVRADQTLLTQVFQNLLANAIKFRGDCRPEIRVRAGREDRAWRFSIRDNGIGIDPAFTDRIFQIFQRLHLRHEYPGTGIGLAICEKIVEGHGGRLWVDSEPGRGSTFYFTIPDAKNEENQEPRIQDEHRKPGAGRAPPGGRQPRGCTAHP